eukprot:TRINITY_DN1951_c0_g1_i2.p1 TRINITY_DN1951_c0_g1~~TRINITY_DN1951_c0_g1_i2.p1  ORF type:complete len:225 (-),score=16.85 TRINITY_DN1951_c0_g1_i2:37-660(-)
MTFNPFFLRTDMQCKMANDSFVAPSATLIGNVEVWDRASIWYNVIVRANTRLVRIGACTNIQDDTVITEADRELNEDHDGSTIVGHMVTVGHGCKLNACTIEDECIVGMGSTLGEGSYMEKHSILGAGSVLLPWARVPSGQLWLGNPAKYVRDLTHEEMEAFVPIAEGYVQNGYLHAREYENSAHYLDATDAGLELGYKTDSLFETV